MAISMKKAVCLVMVAAVLVGAVAPGAEGAIGCGTVVSYLGSCLPYVTDQGPLGGCCGGLKGLYRVARTSRDHRDVCVCLKSLGGSGSGVNVGKVAGLPKLCGVNIGFNISPHTDCNKLQ